MPRFVKRKQRWYEVSVGVDTEQLDRCCEIMFGHTDWEFVDSKILRRHDDENYTVVLFHHEDTRKEEE